MGLSMQLEKWQPWPVLTCDKCGEPIRDWGQAIATYKWSSENSIMSVKVYHKGECDPGRGKDGTLLWEELKKYLPWLLWNHNWGTKQATKKGSTITLDVPKPLDM
jgi:hypothetical protein